MKRIFTLTCFLYAIASFAQDNPFDLCASQFPNMGDEFQQCMNSSSGNTSGNSATSGGVINNPFPDNNMGDNPFPDNNMGDNPFPDNGMGGNPSPDNGMGGNPSPDNGMGGNPFPNNGMGGNPFPSQGSGGMFGSGNLGLQQGNSRDKEPVSKKMEACILNESSEDVESLYNNTITTLKNLGQSKNACSFLTAQAGTLAGNMQAFEQQLKPNLNAKSCYRKELQLKKSYQTILFRMNNHLDISRELSMSFPDYCNQLSRNSNIAEYVEDDYACIANAFANTLAQESASCEVDDEEVEKSYSDSKKAEALSQINSTMNALISGADGCTEQDVKTGVLQSVMSVGTAVAGMTYGSIGTAVGGFLSGIFGSVIKAKQKVSTVDELNKEKNYRNYGCLFSAIQKRRCNDFNASKLDLINCANINDPYNTLLLNDFAMNVDRVFKEGGNAELLKIMGSNNFSGKNAVEFIEQDIIPFLDENLEVDLGDDIYNFKENLKKYAEKIQEVQKIPRGKENKEKRDELISEINKLKSVISSNSFSNILKKYENFLGKNVDDYKKVHFHEKIQQMTREFTRGMISTGQTINDSKDISLMTTAFVKEMRPFFNGHLADNYNANLQRAQANYYDNKEESFNSMAHTITECIVTQGMYLMKDTDFDEGSATSNFEKSPFANYSQVCEQFSCEMGMPDYRDKTSTPDEYRKFQCQNLNSTEQILDKLKSKYLKTGKFCSSGIMTMKKVKSKSK